MNQIATQTLLSFEQATVDAELAAAYAKLQAKLAAKAQRAILKRQAELDKMTRRFKRETIARSKQADGYALCGISFYSVSPHQRDRGNYWRTCSRCGRPLQYYPTYDEAKAHLRECRKA
jgi:hypothetical protein